MKLEANVTTLVRELSYKNEESISLLELDSFKLHEPCLFLNLWYYRQEHSYNPVYLQPVLLQWA